MADKTRGSKIKYRFLKKWRCPAAALLALAVLLGGICYRYFLFMSQTVYRESTSHLSEILRKSDNMLNHLVSRNQMLLHLWNDFLKNASSEEQIRSSLNEMQKETGCAAVVRLVDFIGEDSVLPRLGAALDAILNREGAEYMDCYNAGIPADVWLAAGFTERVEGDGCIIPNYLTPPLHENTEYYYFTNKPENFVMFKADGDQDRPNLK